MGLWLCGRVGVETWGALARVCLCGCVGVGAGVGVRVCVFVCGCLFKKKIVFDNVFICNYFVC